MNIASGAPTNSDSWNDEGNYAVAAPQGSGTETDPYLISTAEELAWVSVNYSGAARNKYFKQTKNIDLGAHYWVPINNSSSQYAYYYDGDNHTISNLFIDTSVQSLSSNNYIGLFGYVEGSSSNHCYIKNLGIVGGSVSGNNYVGAVVGYTEDTNITNCFNEGVSVTGSSLYVGGIVGQGLATITDCYNTGDVQGSSCVGGVVGWCDNVKFCYNDGNIHGGVAGGVVGVGVDVSIQSCYNTGDVQGSIVGGICSGGGWLNSISIRNCYNTGNIMGTDSSGGLTGRGPSAEDARIYNSYNIGNVSSISGEAGGLIGYGTERYIDIVNSYFNMTNTGVSSAVGNDASFTTQAVNYDNMLVTSSGKAPTGMPNLSEDSYVFIVGKYPLLTEVGEGLVYSPTWDGSMTFEPSLDDPSQANSEDNPYIIDSAAKLAYLSENYVWADEKYFLQTENLDLAGHPWTPINNTNTARAYYYDGGNHTVSNLYINTSEQTLTSNNYIGLFGYVYGSSSNHCYIKNLGIVNGSIAGEGSYVGAVVGCARYTDITNCYNEKTDITITGSSYSVGGVAGYNDYGTISGSYNTGAVSGDDSVGGVAGYNDYGTISGSYNTGTVSGVDSVGGVAGYNWYGTISNSYNTGDVTGSSNVGGVAGYIYKGTISNSYNTGDVTGTNYVGGVAGYNDAGTISDSYNTGTVTGESQVGGVVGYVRGSSSSRSVISSCYSTGAIIRSSGSETSFGGVFGYVAKSQYVSVSWCYYNKETSGSVVTKAIGVGTGYQCYGLTTTEMQGAQNENYMYLSSTYWNFASGQYPTLKYVAKPAQN